MGYLDPGLFGILSQVGLAIFLVLVSVFTFFFKPVKKFFRRFLKIKESQAPDEPIKKSGEK
jgi:hypothetical protein